MDHISEILQRVLGRANLGQGVANYGILARWESVVGANLSGSTRPLRIQGDTLWVYVENATLLHSLTYLIPRFLERIREAAPGSSVRKIRFTLNPEV